MVTATKEDLAMGNMMRNMMLISPRCPGGRTRSFFGHLLKRLAQHEDPEGIGAKGQDLGPERFEHGDLENIRYTEIKVNWGTMKDTRRCQRAVPRP